MPNKKNTKVTPTSKNIKPQVKKPVTKTTAKPVVKAAPKAQKKPVAKTVQKPVVKKTTPTKTVKTVKTQEVKLSDVSFMRDCACRKCKPTFWQRVKSWFGF